MKTLFIDQLTADTGKFTDFFLVTQVDRREKKDKTPYLSLKLSDRTGTVDAKMWDVPDGLVVQAGDKVKVEATTGSYRDALQLKVSKLRAAIEEDGVARDDFMPVSKYNRLDLLERLQAELRTITNEPLRWATLNFIMTDTAPRLMDAPAAKKLHQAYLGGLLEHILSLMALARKVCEVYSELNLDILLAAAFIHDIGKLEEYCYETHIGDTRAGRLVGHIIQGSILWAQHSGNLDPATRDHLAHIIASHHGQLEWGAARLPMTREARIFHLLDMIDSGMGLMETVLAGAVDVDGFTQYNGALGTAMWNGKGIQE